LIAGAAASSSEAATAPFTKKEKRVMDKMHIAFAGLRLPLWVMVIVASFVVACSNSKTEVAQGYENVDALPTLYTRNVLSLISDSGITRYRIEAPTWYMYDNAEEPYWYFPDGIKVERFDTLFQTEALVLSDTATYYENRQLWRLDRNVHIENFEGRIFDTQQLFWDQRRRTIYSDSAIRITSEDEVIEGVGFISNEQLTKYSILRTSGIFTVERDNAATADTTDTVAAATTDTLATSLL